MHLMGQWAPGTQNANSPDGEGLGDKLGWFPFPAVEGGAGAPTDVFGGGNGFAVGKDAPPEAVDFLQYATSLDVANRWGETNSGILPVTIGADASITDPNLTGVLEARAERDVRPAVPRPGVPARARGRDQRRRGGAVRRAGLAGAGRPDDRGCRRGPDARPPRSSGGPTARPRRPSAPNRRPRGDRTGGRRRSARRGASGRRSSCSCCLRSPCTSCSCSCRSARASTTAASTGTVSSRSPTSSGWTTTARRSPTRCSSLRLRHVFVIVGLSLLVQLPFALGLAVLLNQRIRGRAILRLLFFLPFVLSEVITAVVWRLLLQPNGLADSTLECVGLGRFVQEWLANPDVVLYTRVRRDHVEVLRVPHDPLPRRPAADPP